MQGVREMTNAVNTGIPGSRDPKVTERMFQNSTTHWKDLLDAFLLKTESLCDNAVMELLQGIFAKWQLTALHDKVFEIAASFLRQAMIEQRADARRFLDRELRKVITLNKEAKVAAEQEHLVELRHQVLEILARREVAQEEVQTKKQFAESAKKAMVKEKIASGKVTIDRYYQEIQEIAVGPCLPLMLVPSIADPVSDRCWLLSLRCFTLRR